MGIKTEPSLYSFVEGTVGVIVLVISSWLMLPLVPSPIDNMIFFASWTIGALWFVYIVAVIYIKIKNLYGGSRDVRL